MSKKIKERMIEELVNSYRDHRNFVLVDYKGMKASQAVEFRNQLKQSRLSMKIVKNAVFRRVFEQIKLPQMSQYLSNMNAVVYGGDDPVTVAKCIYGYKEKNKVLEVRAASVDGQLMLPDQVRQLSALPGRQQLLAQVVGTLAAPMTKMVRTLNAIPVKLLYALKAIEDKQKAAEKK